MNGLNSSLPSIDNNFTNFSSTDSVPGEIHLATSSYRLIPPPSSMIGDLPVQTVAFILLGVGAATPIIFLATVAVALRFRSIRLRRHYSKYVLDGGRTAWSEDIYMYDAYTAREPENAFHQEHQLPPENKHSSVTRETTEARPGSDFDDLPLDLTIRRFFGSTHRDTVVSHRSTQTSIETARTKYPDETGLQSNLSVERITDYPSIIATPSTQATVLDVRALSSLPGIYTPYAMLFSSSDGRPTVEIPGYVSPTASRDSGVRTSLETSDSSYLLETSALVSHSFQSGKGTGTNKSRIFEVFDTEASIGFQVENGGMAKPVQSKSTTSTLGTNSQHMEKEKDSYLATEEEIALRCLDDVLMVYMN